MTKNIWLNLPVKDVAKTADFFTVIGFEINGFAPNSETMVSMKFGEKNFIINFFRNDQLEKFVQMPLTDTQKSVETIISFDAESEDEVRDLTEKVRQAGGFIFSEPSAVQGWMYGAAFADLDGHRWNILYMDMAKAPKS